MVRRRSLSTAARTCSTFEGVVAVLGRPDGSSLAVDKFSLPVLPNPTQNLMHTPCSLASAIPPISENRRRLMQYTHKDTCNNQTLPHPIMPLGTLTHKTPPQHILAGNSWTTSDLRVMSIVLGLLDPPSYKEFSLPSIYGSHPISKLASYMKKTLWNIYETAEPKKKKARRQKGHRLQFMMCPLISKVGVSSCLCLIQSGPQTIEPGQTQNVVTHCEHFWWFTFLVDITQSQIV